MIEEVILVNENDEEVGRMEKMQAHNLGRLHRAFSVILFDHHNQILLQRRAASKYHSRLLWSNTCCSHPMPGESMQEAISRKLNQELGLNASVHFAFAFKYKAALDNELTEHELDHVYIGRYVDDPIPNPDEVLEVRTVTWDDLLQEMHEKPDQFTAWFKLIVEHPEFLQQLKKNGFHTEGH